MNAHDTLAAPAPLDSTGAPGAPGASDPDPAPSPATSMARALERQASVLNQLIDERWRIEQQIGFGSFGKVFRARDIHSGQLAAVKIFHERTEASGYIQELGLLFSEVHPHLVSTLSFGYTKGRRHIVYEYVPGGTLRDLLIRCPRLEPSLALGITQDILKGVAFAHSRQVVHRDLKPENVLLTRHEPPFQAKICDFGLSTRLRHQSKLTSNYGSPGYMAPEQLSGQYDHRVDYYAVGVILYELLFGRRPFQGDLVGIRHAHQHLPLALPEDLPEPLRQLLVGLLARDPDERFAHARDVLHAVSRAQAALRQLPSEQPLSSPRFTELALTPAWRVIAPQRLRRVTTTRQGHLLLGLEDRLTLLTRQGKPLELVHLSAPIEDLIEGGDLKHHLGWLAQGQLWIFERGALRCATLPQEIEHGPRRLIFLPDHEHILIVTPKHLDCMDLHAKLRWRAEIASYGALPEVCLSAEGSTPRIWLAQETPRTQLIALDMTGQPQLRAAVHAHDPLLLAGPKDSVLCGARGQRLITRQDAQGFTLGQLELMQPLLELGDLGSELVAAVSATHLQIFDAQTMRSLHIQRLPEEGSMCLLHRGGAWALDTRGSQTLIERHDLPPSTLRRMP